MPANSAQSPAENATRSRPRAAVALALDLALDAAEAIGLAAFVALIGFGAPLLYAALS